MITTIDASRSAGSRRRTSPNRRSEPAEPTRATTFSLVWVGSSCSVAVTVEKDITDHARVALGLGHDPVEALGARGVPRVGKALADAPRQIRPLLQRPERGGERPVECLRLGDEQGL